MIRDFHTTYHLLRNGDTWQPRVREWNLDYSADGAGHRVIDLVRTLDHLTRNEFLDARRESGGWTIRLGERLRGWSV